MVRVSSALSALETITSRPSEEESAAAGLLDRANGCFSFRRGRRQNSVQHHQRTNH